MTFALILTAVLLILSWGFFAYMAWGADTDLAGSLMGLVAMPPLAITIVLAISWMIYGIVLLFTKGG